MHKDGHHEHGGEFGCCSMSRRSFLAAAAVGSAATAMGWGAVAAAQTREYLDLASLRPNPGVRILSAVLRANPKTNWPGAGYNVEGQREAYEKVFTAAVQDVGGEIEFVSEPLRGKEGTRAFAARVAAEKPDAVLLQCQDLFALGHNAVALQTGVPTIIFAPIGTSATATMKEISYREGVHVVSSLETEAVRRAIHMVKAKRQFEETRLLIVTPPTKFGAKEGPLGFEVRYASMKKMHLRLAATKVDDEVRKLARSMQEAATKIVEPSEADVLDGARFAVMSKRFMQEEGCNAMTPNCFWMYKDNPKIPMPCMAVTEFQDQGVTFACHGELLSAASLMFSSYLFDRPAFMGNPIVETYKDVVVAAHCACATRLNGFDAPPEPLVLRARAETNIGAATQVLMREGQPVTLAQFDNPNELTLDTGTIVGNVDTDTSHDRVNTHMAGGCRTSIEIKMDRMDDARNRIALAHHVISYGNHRRLAESFCQLYGMPVVHSPERAPQRTA